MSKILSTVFVVGFLAGLQSLTTMVSAQIDNTGQFVVPPKEKKPKLKTLHRSKKTVVTSEVISEEATPEVSSEEGAPKISSEVK